MSIYDHVVTDVNGKEIPLSQYRGTVLLIVNTATKCGLTPQYEQLEATYQNYHHRGFEILDFPCNQFLEQAPGTDSEIDSFCTVNYHTTFPRFSKVDVNGETEAPLFKYLKESTTEHENAESAKFKDVIKDLNPFKGDTDIKWNFTKFLIDQTGNPVARFFPTVTPEEIASEIEKLL